jgi:hypothetical protein
MKTIRNMKAGFSKFGALPLVINNFTGTHQNHLFTFTLSALALQWQSWVAATKTV